MTPVASPRRQFSVGKQIVFVVIIVVGLLLLAEGTIRIWALYFRTSYERYNASTGRLELVPSLRYTNAQGLEFRINSKGFVGPEFDDRPPPGVSRIMAVGDSCTFGTGFWQISYPSVLERLVNAAAPAHRVEVINAGIEGYNSTFALGRIRDELLRYQPHLMIVYIGWNDLMKTDPENTAQVDAYPWLAELLDRSYLIKAYKKLLFVNLRPMMFPPGTTESSDHAQVLDRFVPTRYRSNLEAMIRLLGSRGVKVLLVTLPTVVRPGMTADDLRRSRVFFPYFRSAYSVPGLLSLHRAYNRTIVEVGKREGVEVVDLAGVFESLKDRTAYFWDTMHPSEKGHTLIAETLSRRIGELRNQGRL